AVAGGSFALAHAFGHRSLPAGPQGEGRIAFVNADGRIATMNPDGSDVRVATEGPDSDPAWSPDGRRLLFVRSATTASTERSIWSVDADGSHSEQLTHGFVDTQPAWSPDGTTIAFIRTAPGHGPSVPAQLFTMRPDGSGLDLLAAGAF